MTSEEETVPRSHWVDATNRAWRLDEKLGSVHLALMRLKHGECSPDEALTAIAEATNAQFYLKRAADEVTP